MPFTGFALPDIKDSTLDDKKERRKILEYLFQLTEQLRFVLSNLDEDNLSDELKSAIDGAYTNSAALSREITDMQGNVSSIRHSAKMLESEIRDAQGNISDLRQFADSLTLSVSNGATSSSIALMANGVAIASGNIAMSGLVTFTNLSTGGQTQINGANITTGYVAASRIDVNSLYVKHLNAADGTFTGTLSGVNGTFTGTLSAVNGTFGNLTGTGYIFLGNNVTIDTSGLTLLGGTNSTRFFMNPPTASGGSEARWVSRSGYYSLGIYTSARSEKKDIENIGDECSTIIDGLNPVYFKFKGDDEAANRSVGFIADETDEICKEITSYTPDKEPVGVQYSNMTALLVAELQRLRKRVARLEEA